MLLIRGNLAKSEPRADTAYKYTFYNLRTGLTNVILVVIYHSKLIFEGLQGKKIKEQRQKSALKCSITVQVTLKYKVVY